MKFWKKEKESLKADRQEKIVSIRTKITVIVLAAVLVCTAVIGASSIGLSWNASQKQLDAALSSASTLASARVEQQLLSYRNLAESFGARGDIADPKIKYSEKVKVLNEWIERYDLVEANILDTDGNSQLTKQNYAKYGFFSEAMNGKAYFSEPLKIGVTGKYSIVIAAPIWEGGHPNTKVIGVAYFVPNSDFLNDIMKSIKVSKNCNAYMIDKNGNTIADVDENLVMNENIEQQAEGDPSLKKLASYHQAMRNGESGLGQYSHSGVDKFFSYAPVNNTDGWSIAVAANAKDFTGPIINAIMIVIVLMVLLILAEYIFARRISSKITIPMIACIDRLQLIADGDFHSPMPDIDTNDETKTFRETGQLIVDRLNGMINDEKRVLGAMAKGDLTEMPDSSCYVGDLEEVYDAIAQIEIDMNQVLGNMQMIGDQVASGADQVASGAQELSQGSTEQAASVEELVATINQLADDIKSTKDFAENVNVVTEETGVEINKSNEKMTELFDAMRVINKHAEEIGHIVKTIEDIAFQTNILALNAAVEAARAGEAGKGFAVVADEVRALAAKSAEASHDTSELISQTNVAVKDGTSIANDAYELMGETAKKSDRVVSAVRSILDAAIRQDNAIAQINIGVDQISSVVQANSATSEESAASSEELSAQAEKLHDAITKFKLKND